MVVVFDPTVARLLRDSGTLRNRDLAEALGISRQAAYARLKAMVERGELEQVGEGRGAHYRPVGPTTRAFTYPLDHLTEDGVWSDLIEREPSLSALGGDARSVYHYALTELVNNAIDHSGAPEVRVTVRTAPPLLTVEVIDHGIGVFENIRGSLRLPSALAALQELSKGKTTTQPARHSGEGIFFCSKVADRFTIESGTLKWLCDNTVDDMAIFELDPPVRGTTVRFEAQPERPRNLLQIFRAYTEDHAFSKTRTVLKLFEYGVEFMSRSEAKRLTHGLEKFSEVVVDFAGISGVGQGFADEVFRVFASQHPGTRLIPVHMNEPVAFMVARALEAMSRASP